jgi:formate hydrogenlyase subunit 4
VDAAVIDTALRATLHVALLAVCPPLLLGVIGKTKAWFAGRQGPSLLQPYRDMAKCLRKGAVYSRTTSWAFRAGPVAALATTMMAGLLVPLAGGSGVVSFTGDFIVFAYLLGLGRFATAVAALDTGSSFEGMGASREMAFSALVEPVLFLVLATLALETHSVSFATAFATLGYASWSSHGAALLLAALALFVVLLAENSRVPVDDPATHLELTMIHEVMVLDHGGPDLGIILYGSAAKMFVIGAVLIGLLHPFSMLTPLRAAALLAAGQLAIGVLVGVVESSMARLRLPRVPQFLIAASVLAAIGAVMLLSTAG